MKFSSMLQGSTNKWLTAILSKHWLGSLVVAFGFHIAIWWLPVQMPSAKLKKRHVVKLRLASVKPPPPAPRQEVQPPPVQRQKPVKRLKPKKRRWKPKKRRRVKPKRRKIKPRPVLPKPVIPVPPPVEEPKEPPTPEPTKPVVKETKKAPPVKRVKAVPPRPPAPRRPVRVDLGPYKSGLSQAIEQHKRYPRMAHRMGFEGKVLLAIKIKKDGTLQGSPKLLRSSGYGMLDKEAIRMIKAAAPFKAMPNGYSNKVAEFRIPVNFAIER